MTQGIAVLLLSWGCSGKAKCPDLYGGQCSEYGIPNENRRAFCDECQTLWTCLHTTSPANEYDYGYYLVDPGFPCSCIDDDGYQYPDNDSGTPRQCQVTY